MMKNILIFAHRGASGYEYENSFSSFDKAIELGADGLETDAWLLSDGNIVLHHDKAVKDLETGETKNISKMTLEEIKKIYLPNGDKIPELHEFFSRYCNKLSSKGKPLLFSIDLQDLKVGKEIIPILEEFNLFNRVYLCGNSKMVLKRVRKISDKVLLVASNLESALKRENFAPEAKFSKLKINAFNFQAGIYKSEMKTLLQENNLNLFIWDLHSEEMLRKFLVENPHAIYSNFPDLAVKVRNELN